MVGLTGMALAYHSIARSDPSNRLAVMYDTDATAVGLRVASYLEDPGMLARM